MCLQCKVLPPDSKCPAMYALESLTPGGSEFWEDPARCVEAIRATRESLMTVMRQTVIRAKNAEERLRKIVEGTKTDG